MNRWFDVYATRAGAEGSNKVAVLFTDISERKRAEIELQRLADDLKDADRRKTEFLATLAHELRNPLAPMRSGAADAAPVAAATRRRSRACPKMMERQLEHMVRPGRRPARRGPHQRAARWSCGTARIDLKDVLDGAVETALPLIERPPPPARRRGCRRAAAAVRRRDAPDAGRQQPAEQRRQVHAARRRASTLAARRDERRGGARACPTTASASRRERSTRYSACSPRSGAARERTQGGLGHRPVAGAQHGRAARRQRDGRQRRARAGQRVHRAPAAGRPRGALPRRAAPAPAARGAPRCACWSWTTTATRPTPWRRCSTLLGHEAQVAHDGRAALDAMQDFSAAGGVPRHRHAGHERLRSGRGDPRRPRASTSRLLVALTGWGGEDDRQRTQRGRIRPAPDQAGRPGRDREDARRRVKDGVRSDGPGPGLSPPRTTHQSSANSLCAILGQHNFASFERSAHRYASTSGVSSPVW